MEMQVDRYNIFSNLADIMIQGIKNILKNQSAQNLPKPILKFVDLVVLIPMTLESSQSKIVWENYRVLNFLANS